MEQDIPPDGRRMQYLILKIRWTGIRDIHQPWNQIYSILPNASGINWKQSLLSISNVIFLEHLLLNLQHLFYIVQAFIVIPFGLYQMQPLLKRIKEIGGSYNKTNTQVYLFSYSLCWNAKYSVSSCLL